MAANGSKRGWRLGRDLWILRRSDAQRRGAKHTVPDGLGGPGLARGGRHPQRLCGSWHRLLAAHAKPGWFLGRAVLLGHGLSAGVLPELSHVPAVFPVARADNLSEGHDTEWASYESTGLALVVSSRFSPPPWPAAEIWRAIRWQYLFRKRGP